jgi:hypothetical protein
MQLLSGSLGISGGVGGSSGTTSGTSSGTKTNTYSGDQSGLQSTLASIFQSLSPSLASGGISPNVQAMQTAGADQINKTSAGLGDRMTKFLAARGFGSSGTSGKTALQGELGRESALGANASAASGLQLQQNNQSLQDMLGFAFANPGQNTTGVTSGTSSGTSYGVGVGGGAAFGPTPA